MNDEKLELFNELLAVLPSVRDHHAPTSRLYQILNWVAKAEAQRLFAGNDIPSNLLGPFRDLVLPFHKMGKITSLHLFGLDELILFSFYWANRHRYRTVLDLGANIGLHSVVMNKCNYQVRAFEPDPETYKVLVRNLDLNRASTVEAINAAVSTHSGTMDFVRVLDNLTGNHLAGAKTGSYGDLQTISVRVEEFRPLLGWADLAKIDVEGHEKNLVLSTIAADWASCDAFFEVGSEPNARAIFEHFNNFGAECGLKLFSQKRNWQRVTEFTHMPTSYHDGSLFATTKAAMLWD